MELSVSMKKSPGAEMLIGKVGPGSEKYSVNLGDCTLLLLTVDYSERRSGSGKCHQFATRIDRKLTCNFLNR
jgi:hypothetical protein